LVEELVPRGAAEVEDQVLDAGGGVLAYARRALLGRAGDAVAVDEMGLDGHAVAALQMRGEPLVRVLADECRAHRRAGDPVWVAAGILCVPPHPREPGSEALGRDPDRHPAVPEPPGAPERRLGAAADPQGRPTRLRGCGLDRDP